ncbi:hypothetical protein V1521DRAFT_419610 [Lipomyces starkeyi]
MNSSKEDVALRSDGRRMERLMKKELSFNTPASDTLASEPEPMQLDPATMQSGKPLDRQERERPGSALSLFHMRRKGTPQRIIVDLLLIVTDEAGSDFGAYSFVDKGLVETKNWKTSETVIKVELADGTKMRNRWGPSLFSCGPRPSLYIQRRLLQTIYKTFGLRIQVKVEYPERFDPERLTPKREPRGVRAEDTDGSGIADRVQDIQGAVSVAFLTAPNSI